MCYSLNGRIQTRLASLLIPGLVVAWALLRTGDQRYFSMFIVMIAISLDLDVVLYSRILRYQARWHTYLLGVGEFFLLFAVTRILAGTLPLIWIVAFYTVSWIGILLLVNVVIPVVDPLWAEHGGELWRPAVPMHSRNGRRQVAIARSRSWISRSPAQSFILVSLALLIALQLTALPTSLTLIDVLGAISAASVFGRAASYLTGNHDRSLADDIVVGLIVALVLRDSSPFVFVLGAALAASAASLLRVRDRPIFNGAACALVLCVLFAPGAYAGDLEWGNSLLLPLIIGNLGLLAALLLRRVTLMIAFITVVLIHGILTLNGLPESPHMWLQVWLPNVLPAYLIFFAGFVLTDRSSTSDSRRDQAIMGLGVAAGGVLLNHVGIGLAYAAALLVWNYVEWIYRSWTGSLTGSLGNEAPIQSTSRRFPLSRRAFLGAAGAAIGSIVLGGSLKRLSGIDPAILSIPPDTVLAGGQAIPRFVDVASAAGITRSHHADPNVGSPAIGTGAAWGDFDADGKIDLYVTDQVGSSHLYRNNGDGTFTDVAVAAGVAHPGGRPTSATFVDFDNDGWPDLYVGVADGPNVLYRNNGDGTFSDVTEKSGLGEQLGRTMSTAWADYDGDGYLDVFVSNYPSEPISFDGNVSIIEDVRTVAHMSRPHNRLYHNNGDGTFTDVTHLLGDLTSPPTRGFGFSAVWLDFNNDGRPDLYVAYDFGSVVTPNTLWRNDGPGIRKGEWRFTQMQDEAGVAARANTMGVVSGDFNNDGWIDLAVSNIGPNYLYRNEAGRTYQDIARPAGVAHAVDTVDNALNPSMTWGLALADFNNDGWLDLYLAAGAMDFENIPQPNQLYINNHTGGFIDVSAASGANDPGQGRSVAVADFNDDGHLDMFVANYGQPPLLYRNVSRASGTHWFSLELEGTQSNRDAVGARVTVHAGGLPRQMREVQIGQGLGSCNARSLHFGLGTATEAGTIEIRWPSGRRQSLSRVAADRKISIREPGPSRWPSPRNS